MSNARSVEGAESAGIDERRSCAEDEVFVSAIGDFLETRKIAYPGEIRPVSYILSLTKVNSRNRHSPFCDPPCAVEGWLFFLEN